MQSILLRTKEPRSFLEPHHQQNIIFWKQVCFIIPLPYSNPRKLFKTNKIRKSYRWRFSHHGERRPHEPI